MPFVDCTSNGRRACVYRQENGWLRENAVRMGCAKSEDSQQSVAWIADDHGRANSCADHGCPVNPWSDLGYAGAT